MYTQCLLIPLVCCALPGSVLALSPASPQPTSPSFERNDVAAIEVPTFSLAQAGEPMTMRESTTVETRGSEESWEIDGPIELRSADPEPPGELVVKNIFDYSTSSDGSDDDFEYEFEVEYGLVKNHELIFEVPVEMGDGGEQGNADITLGWHWRLWEEQDWAPAFALRNYIRIPSGYQSDGVDYELRGLLTKTVIPGTMRFHLNPFLKSVNGNRDDDTRWFQWGFLVGMDYRLADNLLFIMDYRHETGESFGTRNQHYADFGLDWHINEQNALGFVVRAGLDGDDEGENFGCAMSYILSFDTPKIGG